MTPAEAVALVRSGGKVRLVVGRGADDPTLEVWAEDGSVLSESVAGWSAGVVEPVCSAESDYLLGFFANRFSLQEVSPVTTKVHDVLDEPPCPSCAAETESAETVNTSTLRDGRRVFADVGSLPAGVRYCPWCGRTFTPRRAVIAGPAGHWWAYAERFGAVFCKPRSVGETEAPPHPDSYPGDTWADHEWGESEASAPATTRALLLLLGRDPAETVEVTPLDD